MTALLLSGLGLTFTTLLVVLPLLHLRAWAGAGLAAPDVALAVAPLLALAVALARPRPWATLFLFPVAHLPLLVARPDLTGTLVYAGPAGLAALAAIAAVAAGWCVAAAAAARTEPAPRARVLPRADLALAGLSVAVGAAVLAAFLGPVLARRDGAEPSADQVAVLAGVAVAAWVSGRLVVGELADLWLDGRARARWLARLSLERRPNPTVLWSALLVAATLAALALLVFGAPPAP